MKRAFFYKTPIGEVGFAERDGFITDLFFPGRTSLEEHKIEETPVIKQAHTQLVEYFDKKRTEFNIPFFLEGTDFEKSVWNALLEIPYGEIRTYKQIATRLGKPNACRAVGRANGQNPISIMFPCHRVIGTNGTLTGYGGGLPAKKYLLEMEGAL